jgi:hypothetical protein
MAKLKINFNFWIIPNSLLNNSKISLKAKWLFWYLQSKPDWWDFSVNKITFQCKEWRDAVIGGIKELEMAWHLERKQFRTQDGKWDVIYALYWQPQASNRYGLSVNGSTVTDETVSVKPVNIVIKNKVKKNSNKDNINTDILKNFNKFWDSNLNKKFQEFINHRKEIWKPLRLTWLESNIKKISDWLKKFPPTKIIDFIDKSIQNWRQGIFEEKTTLEVQEKPQKTKKLFVREDWSFFEY